MKAIKKGIIVASAGTTYEKTRKLCIESIENRIKEQYKDFLVLRAFTSQVVIDKLKKRDGYLVDNPRETLERMKENEVNNIYIQPLHIILGHEYEKLIRQVKEFINENNNFNIKISKPLLYDHLDYCRVVEGLELETLDDEAVVFMGHGTGHSVDESYKKLKDTFLDKGYENVFIGTLENEKTLEDIIAELKEQRIKRVKLMPFMLVAGNHAMKDMASDMEDSWKTKLLLEGFDVDISLKGLGEIKGIQDIYINHLEDMINGRGCCQVYE
jgi:sirohydrochlorin cobaltochelatase